MMYASKSPAERNYKDLLNKLYDSSNSQEEYYEEMEQQAMQPQQTEPPAAEQQVLLPTNSRPRQSRKRPRRPFVPREIRRAISNFTTWKSAPRKTGFA